MLVVKINSVLFGIVAFSAILLANEVEPAAEPDKAMLKEAAATLVADCKQKVGASDEDAKMLKAKQIPATQEGLCLIECILNAANIMKNGTLYKPGAIQAFTPGQDGDQVKVEKMKKMVETCDKELGKGDPDNCKNAKSIVECVMKNGKEFGFKFVR